MWSIFQHKQDETVEFEARIDPDDDDFYEVRPVRTAGTSPEQGAVSSWRVVTETFLKLYGLRKDQA